VHRRIRHCRACEAEALTPVLDLGEQPLANALPADPAGFADEARYPLVLCLCERCGLVQLVDVIDPEVLFGHYLYVTGISTTIAEHNRRYAAAVTDALGLGAQDLVVEVASNDGSLLACFQDLGVGVLGVEPARNIAALATERGIPTEAVFFNRQAGMRLREEAGPVAAVIGNNVLAHVGDPVDFLAGAAALLRDDGRAIVEVPYLEEMLDRLEYDTIYHEHLCYFSVTALTTIAVRAGLRVVRVDRVPVHGGSIRVWFARADAVADHAPEVLDLVAAERRAGMADPARLRRFATDVAANRERLRTLLGELRAGGATVAAYGAPAKGNTLLNYCDIGTDLVAWTVDRSPLKQGRYTPGMHLAILPPEVLLERQPDYVLILAWNFADEIIAQQAAYRQRGGRFILPIPEPRVL
jgi:SAM-dependent methyltransferase